jgi:hypothetical protein
MLRTALATFMIAGMAAWGQAQNDTSGGAVKVDRATAYYHYALANMYAEMAAASGDRKREYENKAIENHKAAVKADPQTPMLRLQEPGPVTIFPIIGPGRTVPKADPSSQRP